MHSRRAQRARTYLFSTNLNTSKNFVLPSGTPGNRTPISDPIAVPVLLYCICYTIFLYIPFFHGCGASRSRTDDLLRARQAL